MPPEIRSTLTDLSKCLTKRERVLSATVITATEDTLDGAIGRALALAVVEQEIVQITLRGDV
jgi:hypothetical protein